MKHSTLYMLFKQPDDTFFKTCSTGPENNFTASQCPEVNFSNPQLSTDILPVRKQTCTAHPKHMRVVRKTHTCMLELCVTSAVLQRMGNSYIGMHYMAHECCCTVWLIIGHRLPAAADEPEE